MLSDKEKRCCAELLQLIPQDQLLSLKDTVTNKAIDVRSRNEAVRAIVSYSESAEQLLRRRKIKRDLLFQYLAGKNVIITPTAAKVDLIQRVLQFWGIEVATKVQWEEEEDIRVPVKPKDEIQQLAEQFCTWFFNLLNSHHPLRTSPPAEGWGPQHFWADSQLRMEYHTPDLHQEQHQGAQLVSQRLLAIVKDDQLVFNPNIAADGVKGKKDPHGLVAVLVCGTVHRQENCLGVFEQCFCLVADPAKQNNYKVKSTNLRIRGKEVMGIPRLEAGSDELLPITA
ncbi:PREDICTED: uncharacterized protein C3orf38 homolog [Branchiostoma belcheri]|uniref:Uncharacterized protein C3orf38 homolog n=1 Tax=Branchiostoma belcheri TaxID=7741 RepID=A0A6P5AAA7_BRABE|nr:PREDICTED: uncharacterized protein C3orf38 homolog [Branchiostoma belcheri]KAI8501305.1 hypothetical protein Bbelb_205760 [Branchiostoma belcheri]